jgi:hypothetical protein
MLCRYNEFYELHEKLKKKFFEANALKLPGKRFLGNNFDPEFIRSRKERLHEFVLKMAAVSNGGGERESGRGWRREGRGGWWWIGEGGG